MGQLPQINPGTDLWPPEQIVGRAERLISDVFGRPNAYEIQEATKDPRFQQEYRDIRVQLLNSPDCRGHVRSFQRYQELSDHPIHPRSSASANEVRVSRLTRQVRRAFPPRTSEIIWNHLNAVGSAPYVAWTVFKSEIWKKVIGGILVFSAGGAAALWVKNTSTISAPKKTQQPTVKLTDDLFDGRFNGSGTFKFVLTGAYVPNEGWGVEIDGVRNAGNVSDIAPDGSGTVQLQHVLPLGKHKITFRNGDFQANATAMSHDSLPSDSCVDAAPDLTRPVQAVPQEWTNMSVKANSRLFMPTGGTGREDQSSLIKVQAGSCSKDLVMTAFSPHGFGIRFDYRNGTISGTFHGKPLKSMGGRTVIPMDGAFRARSDIVIAVSEQGSTVRLSILSHVTQNCATFRGAKKHGLELTRDLLEVQHGSVRIGTIAVSSLSRAVLNPANSLRP